MAVTRDTLVPPTNTRNPGRFGPAVIGGSKPQEPTAAQLKAQPELATLARPAVPEGEYEKELAWMEIGAPIFGPAVIGDSEPQKPTAGQLKAQPGLAKLHGMPDAAPAAAPSGKAQLPIAKLKDYLDANPYVLDSLIAAEFERKDGPRKAALRVLLEQEKRNVTHEVDGDVVARPDVIARLEEALKGAPATAV